MTILVTGAAGFIGSELVIKLLARGDTVVGIDNHNDYYDPGLKEARLMRHASHPNYTHLRLDITSAEAVNAAFDEYKFDKVVNLAAQAGVRYSIENPAAYINTNIVGFGHILEGCRHHNIAHLVYASSSSVYGGNTKMPFSVHDNVDHPLSLYAASKKSNELMAHTYSHLYGLPTTGLRFFTVYGPWGRPDMSPFLFADAMIRGEPINVFNDGNMARDFTFIDDIVEGVIRVLDKTASPAAKFDASRPDPATSTAPYRVFNIGNGNPIQLMDYIGALETALGVTARKNFMPMQPGDLPATSADTSELGKWVGFQPDTPVVDGVQKFADWYLAYHQKND